MLRKSEDRRGTSATLSLASSSASPPPPPVPPPPRQSSPVLTAAAVWMPSTGLQLHSRPWLPSRLELDGQTLAVSSVEEQETETSLALSPPVIRSLCCRHLRKIYGCYHHLTASVPNILCHNQKSNAGGAEQSKSNFINVEAKKRTIPNSNEIFTDLLFQDQRCKNRLFHFKSSVH